VARIRTQIVAAKARNARQPPPRLWPCGRFESSLSGQEHSASLPRALRECPPQHSVLPGAGVTNYRFYFLDGGRNNREPENRDCDDDLKALARAYELCGDFDVEVWCGTRRVCRIKRGTTSVSYRGNTSK